MADWRYLQERVKLTAITLLTAAAVLLLLDWALFDTPVAAPHLPVDDNGTPNEKLLLAARYRDADVLYLGDSRIFYGVDPSVVSEECGCGPGYNAAVSAADTRLNKIMADRLLDDLSPDVVVIGVSQWDLSDAARVHVWGPARELVPPWQLAEFGATLDPAEQVEAVISGVWRLYRYRGEVRAALDPSTAARFPKPRRGFDEYRQAPRLREQDFEERERQWFSDFSVHGRRSEALRELLADLRGKDIQVMLVAPPLYPSFHARVRPEVDAFRMAVERLATESGAAFEDLAEPRRVGLDSDEFRDVVHLDEDGAEKLSHHIGKVLRSRLDLG